MSDCNKLVLVPIADRATGSVVEDDTVFFFRSMSEEELRAAIEKLLKDLGGSVVHITRAVRGKLLPALIALRERTPRGQWKGVLASMGLTVEQWRQLRHRERVAMQEIGHALGEQRKQRQPRKRELISETEAQSLARAGARMAKALMAGHIEYARRLAADYLEAYESAA